jgi:ribosomal protein S1
MVMCSQLSGCFVYQNVLSWEEPDISKKQQLAKSSLFTKVEFQLDRSQKFITLPFLFLNYSQRKNNYTPRLKVISPIDSGQAIVYFHFEVLNSENSVFFSDSVLDTFQLSALNFDEHDDYMAISTDLGREYKKVNLNILGNDMKVNYEVHLLNKDSTTKIIEHQNILLSKKRIRRFGSFF